MQRSPSFENAIRILEQQQAEKERIEKEADDFFKTKGICYYVHMERERDRERERERARARESG